MLPPVQDIEMAGRMATLRKVPVLPGKVDESAASGETNLQLERAAALVGEFTAQSALPSLDRLLEGTIAGDKDSAEAISDLADGVTRQTDLLYEEVARFLTLAPDRAS